MWSCNSQSVCKRPANIPVRLSQHPISVVLANLSPVADKQQTFYSSALSYTISLLLQYAILIDHPVAVRRLPCDGNLMPPAVIGCHISNKMLVIDLYDKAGMMKSCKEFRYPISGLCNLYRLYACNLGSLYSLLLQAYVFPKYVHVGPNKESYPE